LRGRGRGGGKSQHRLECATRRASLVFSLARFFRLLFRVDAPLASALLPLPFDDASVRAGEHSVGQRGRLQRRTALREGGGLSGTMRSRFPPPSLPLASPSRLPTLFHYAPSTPPSCSFASPSSPPSLPPFFRRLLPLTPSSLGRWRRGVST
jgi:hypothetical protein